MFLLLFYYVFLWNQKVKFYLVNTRCHPPERPSLTVIQSYYFPHSLVMKLYVVLYCSNQQINEPWKPATQISNKWQANRMHCQNLTATQEALEKTVTFSLLTWLPPPPWKDSANEVSACCICTRPFLVVKQNRPYLVFDCIRHKSWHILVLPRTSALLPNPQSLLFCQPLQWQSKQLCYHHEPVNKNIF